MFILAQRTYTKGTNQNELTQNARVCFDRLSRELRQAEELITDVSATTSEIFFQDGHNSDEISYIKYNLENEQLYRTHKAYYFPADPSIYVYHSSIDEFGTPAASTTLSSRVIGEYFSNINFQGDDGLINIIINLSKANVDLQISSKVYIRNY